MGSRTTTAPGEEMGAEPLKVLESRRRDKGSGSARLGRLFGWRTRRGALLVGFLLFTCLLFPREPAFEVTTLREGFPARRDIIAPFQFYVLKDRDRLRTEQVAAARRVAPVYSVDPTVAPRVRALLDSLADAEGLGSGAGSRLAARLRSLGLSTETLRILSGPEGKRLFVLARRIGEQAYLAGLLPEIESARLETDAVGPSVERDGIRMRVPWGALHDRASLREIAWEEGQRAFPIRPEATQALQELISAVVVPNLRIEASTTERLRAGARAEVDPYDGLVRRDEKIIGSHEIASAEHIRKLESLRAWKARTRISTAWRQDLLPLLGRLTLITFLILGFVGYLKINHRTVYQETNLLLLLAILTASVMGVGWVVVNQFRGYEMLIPVTVLSLAAALLFGQALAFAATLVASLLTGIVFGLGLPFMTGSALAGIAAIATATGVRRRRDFYRPMILIALAYALAIVAMGLVDG